LLQGLCQLQVASGVISRCFSIGQLDHKIEIALLCSELPLNGGPEEVQSFHSELTAQLCECLTLSLDYLDHGDLEREDDGAIILPIIEVVKVLWQWVIETMGPGR